MVVRMGESEEVDLLSENSIFDTCLSELNYLPRNASRNAALKLSSPNQSMSQTGQLNLHERREIRIYLLKNPNETVKNVAQMFSEEFDKKVTTSTVHNIRKR